jgi:hypothetical protein
VIVAVGAKVMGVSPIFAWQPPVARLMAVSRSSTVAIFIIPPTIVFPTQSSA